MEQYIPKSVVLAEIERLIKKNELYLGDTVSDEVRYQKASAYSVLCDLRYFLNTIKVKEVGEPSKDLEKEFDKYCENYIFDDECEVYTARKFFELGFKARKGEEGMTYRELLEKAAHRFRLIADDTNRITSGNLPHNLTCLRGFALRAAESIERNLQEPTIVYVITRCEEHSDYVEEVFFDEDKAQEYCDQFKGNENEYARHITKVKVTL